MCPAVNVACCSGKQGNKNIKALLCELAWERVNSVIWNASGQTFAIARVRQVNENLCCGMDAESAIFEMTSGEAQELIHGPDLESIRANNGNWTKPTHGAGSPGVAVEQF